jgi:hypothetical protein
MVETCLVVVVDLVLLLVLLLLNECVVLLNVLWGQNVIVRV